MAKRAHDYGLSLGGKPGPRNHLCDIEGIEIGHEQVSAPAAKDGPGILTGVSVIFPRPKNSPSFMVPAAGYAFNGNGEVTGLSAIETHGSLEGPIALTGTFSVGMVSQAARKWMRTRYPQHEHANIFMGLPVVAETYDGFLHRIDSEALQEEHVFRALENAKAGNASEGGIGGGSGMMSFGFKSGIGSASRVFKVGGQEYRLGALAQSNYGQRQDLRILGRAVGMETEDKLLPNFQKNKDGSVIVVLATDALLDSRQLKKLCQRASLAMAHMGAVGRHSSGDFFLAFSTQSPASLNKHQERWDLLRDEELDPFFEATVQATFEALLNALLASQDTTSGSRKIFALPHDLFAPKKT